MAACGSWAVVTAAIVISMSLVAIVLGAVIGGANLAAPMIVIAYALCVAMGLEPGSNEAALLMISSYVAANAPTSYFYSSLQAMGYSALQTVTPDAPVLTYGTYLYHNWPMIIFGFITIAICILCFPLHKKGKKDKTAKEQEKVATKQYLSDELNKAGKMGAKDYVMIVILVLVLIGLLTMDQDQAEYCLDSDAGCSDLLSALHPYRQPQCAEGCEVVCVYLHGGHHGHWRRILCCGHQRLPGWFCGGLC